MSLRATATGATAAAALSEAGVGRPAAPGAEPHGRTTAEGTAVGVVDSGVQSVEPAPVVVELSAASGLRRLPSTVAPGAWRPSRMSSRLREY
jgi:hypothetical protein